MLDIDFLNVSRPVAGVLLYLYRSGALRRRLRDCIEATARANGETLTSFDRDELAAGWTFPGLFPSVRFCDLGNNRSSRVADRALLMDILRLKPAAPTVIFAPFDRALRDEAMKIVEVVEEPAVTGPNLQLLLRFLTRQNEFCAGRKAHEDPRFEEHFRRWLAEATLPTLLELGQEVDRALLLYTNRSTSEFEPPPESESLADGRSHVVRALEGVVTGGDPFEIAELLRAVSLKASRGWSHRQLADDLCRASRVLVMRQANAADPGPPKLSGSGFLEAAWLWSLLLLAWAASIERKGPDVDRHDPPSVLVQIDQLAREFRRRAVSTADPLVTLWDVIAKTVMGLGQVDEGRSDQPYLLLQSLLATNQSAAEAQWIQMVRRLARSSRQVGCEQPGHETANATLNGFSDLIGRLEIVSHLRKRFENNSHRRPLAIIGEKGSGKATIARLYGKALLCEGARVVDGSPCGQCPTCMSFDTARPFGYIEINLAHPSAENHVREHIAALDRVPFSCHRVVVFTNPVGASDLLDLVLKPMEDGAYVTTFVVLMESEGAVRPSVLSRCDMVRTGGLRLEDSRRLIAPWLPADTDERVYDLIAMVGRGLPGKIARSAQIVCERSAWDLESAKTALGAGWGWETLCYWQNMLAQGTLPASALELPASASAGEAISRLRRVLWRLGRRYPGQETALLGLEEQFFEVVEALDACGRRLGMSATNLIGELATVFLNDGIVDTASFRRAGRDARALIELRASSRMRQQVS